MAMADIKFDQKDTISSDVRRISVTLFFFFFFYELNVAIYTQPHIFVRCKPATNYLQNCSMNERILKFYQIFPELKTNFL